MKPPEYYRGREQTYLKHFFLERYLERVAYHIGFHQNDFIYVDCFSGPWKSEDEAFEDTSFMIAINQLQKVRDGLAQHGKHPRMRHIFIERDPAAYQQLEVAMRRRGNVKTIPGEFEACITPILDEIGTSFSLCFIDPTGWTGFGINRITPLLQHSPGEVIVNFMFDHINRFLDDPRPELARTFDDLFGGPGWQEVIRPGPLREESIVRFYAERMKQVGNFAFVTHTRILKPLQDRSYFYLIYGTRHPKGVIEFRNVEKRFVNEQERVRSAAQQHDRVARTGQLELLPPPSDTSGVSLDREREEKLRQVESRLTQRLGSEPMAEYQDLLAFLLAEPLVWESDVKDIIKRLREEGILTIEGLGPRQRAPRRGCQIRLANRLT